MKLFKIEIDKFVNRIKSIVDKSFNFVNKLSLNMIISIYIILTADRFFDFLVDRNIAFLFLPVILLFVLIAALYDKLKKKNNPLYLKFDNGVSVLIKILLIFLVISSSLDEFLKYIYSGTQMKKYTTHENFTIIDNKTYCNIKISDNHSFSVEINDNGCVIIPIKTWADVYPDMK